MLLEWVNKRWCMQSAVFSLENAYMILKIFHLFMGEYYITIELYSYNNIHDKLHNSSDFIFSLAFRNSSHCIVSISDHQGVCKHAEKQSIYCRQIMVRYVLYV